MNDRWQPYKATADRPWNLGRVVHLHRVAGLGASWDQIQQDLHDGVDAAIMRLLEGKLPPKASPAGFDSLSDGLADAGVLSGDPDRLKAWWFFRMLFTPDPLGERLVLMWHNHFATSQSKVADLTMMRRQYQAFREFSRAPFEKLLSAMIHDPALLVWLDAPENRKAKGNENLGRELMELFTIGVGNYTENDVKEAARALTGLSVMDGRFRYVADWHDSGDKTLLGKTADFDADSLCDLLLASRFTAHRLSWRLCNTFLGDGAAISEDLQHLADGLYDSGLNVGWAVETILRSQLFHSDHNIGTHVVGPPQFLAATVRSIGLDAVSPSTLLLSDWSRRLGQDLFYPPNVGGWSEGTSWLTTRSVISRANFAVALFRGELNRSGVAPDLHALARRADCDSTLGASLRFFNNLLLGGRLSQSSVDQIAQLSAHSLADAVAGLLATPEAQLA